MSLRMCISVRRGTRAYTHACELLHKASTRADSIKVSHVWVGAPRASNPPAKGLVSCTTGRSEIQDAPRSLVFSSLLSL